MERPLKRPVYVSEIAAFLVSHSSSTFGITCPAYIPPTDESIEVETDDRQVSITLPAELDGHDLTHLILWVYGETGNDIADVVRYSIRKQSCQYCD